MEAAAKEILDWKKKNSLFRRRRFPTGLSFFAGFFWKICCFKSVTKRREICDNIKQRKKYQQHLVMQTDDVKKKTNKMVHKKVGKMLCKFHHIIITSNSFKGADDETKEDLF